MRTSITGTRLMTAPSDRQLGRLGQEQQRANAAAKRLAGEFDPYSSKSKTAAVGLGSETQVTQYTHEKQSIQLLKLRQQQVDVQIDSASKINTNFRSYLYSLRSLTSETSIENIQAQAQFFANSFISTLNESYAGSYTLGGDKDQDICVDTAIAKTPLNIGSPISTDYYRGGSTSGTLILGGVPVEQFPVAANHAAFASTLTAIRLMMNPAVTNSPNDPALIQALRVVEEGMSHYNSAISTNANNTRNVENAEERLQTLISASQDSIKNNIGSPEYDDIVEQMSALHQIKIHQSLMEGRIDNIKNLLNRMR